MHTNKQVYRSGPAATEFAQAVKVGDALYVSGQVGMDENGHIPADLAAQMQLAYVNLEQVLAQFDASMEHIVDEVFFVTDMQEFMSDAAAIYAARHATYGVEPAVCHSLLGVSALALPALKIEIKCVARVA